MFLTRSKEREEAFMSHVSEEVQARFANPNPIDVSEYKELRANSYERHYLLPKYSNEVLLEIIQYSMVQAGMRPIGEFELSNHYGHAVTSELIPELLKRIKDKTI